MKKYITVLLSAVVVLTAGCTKGDDSNEESQEPTPTPVTTKYQLKFDESLVGSLLFYTPNFYKSAMGGGETCYVGLAFHYIKINEWDANDYSKNSYILTTGDNPVYGGFKSEMLTAHKDTKIVEVTFKVVLKAFKGTGISQPVLTRTFDLSFDLYPIKGQDNIYNVTCGSTANVLMIGGETARIDNW